MSKKEALAAQKRGDNYHPKGEWNKAIKQYTKAINLYDKDPSFYSNRSACYALLNQFDKALADGKKCIELKPDWAEGYQRVGYALYRLQKFDEAKEAYEKGLKIDPNDAALKRRLSLLEYAMANAPDSSSDSSDSSDSSESSSSYTRYLPPKDLEGWKEKIREHLLGKEGSKLKEYCAAKKVSTDGTKEDIVNALLNKQNVSGPWQDYEEWFLEYKAYPAFISNEETSKVLNRSVPDIISKRNELKIKRQKERIKEYLFNKCTKSKLKEYCEEQKVKSHGIKWDLVNALIDRENVSGSWSDYEEYWLLELDDYKLSQDFMAKVLSRTITDVSQKLVLLTIEKIKDFINRNWKENDLKEFCKSKGIGCDGNKQDLIQRLSQNNFGTNISIKGKSRKTDYKQTIAALRNMIPRDMKFAGFTFVLSGNLSMTQNKLKDIIEFRGGRVCIEVNKDTDFVIHRNIANENKKTKTAKRLNVPIIKEKYIHDSIASDGILDAKLYRIDGVNDEDQKVDQEDEEEPTENDQVEDEELHGPMMELVTLEKLHKEWYRSNDINVRNLGIYLKNVVDGYRASIDRNADYGYSKFGTYARSFCESFCNFLLKGEYEKAVLAKKIKKLSKKYEKFPTQELHSVREKTNKVVHAVGFNEDARNRFMSADEHHVLIIVIYYIALWLNDYLNIHT